MRFLPNSADELIDSAANAFDMFVGGGVADLTRTPSSIIEESAQCTVRRYRPPARHRADRAPVLLVPPLAAPASCFDLRRGCSMVDHLIQRGHPTYLVDYGPIAFSDRELGLEHWVEEVIPRAITIASRDSGGALVNPIGWCLGGIMTLLAAAGDPKLPMRSIVLVASPFDFTKVRMAAPVRRLAKLTGGALITGVYRTLGGAPAPLVSLGFRATGLQRYLTKPLFLLEHLDNRETLAHTEAVDDYMAHMFAYPGRTFGQLYHQFFIVNELAEGKIELDHRTLSLADVKQPVLVVAGEADVLAPKEAVEAVTHLLPNAAKVRYETAPGGHLGVLTGRSAVRSTWSSIDGFLDAQAPTPSVTKRTQATAAA